MSAMTLRWRLKEIAHRCGWIASPSLAFMGVPFGPEKRDLAGEVMTDTARSHDAGNCPVCHPGTREPCGAQAVFWPDVEACDAECILPRGHQPADIHEDETLGEWSEDGLPTRHPA